MILLRRTFFFMHFKWLLALTIIRQVFFSLIIFCMHLPTRARLTALLPLGIFIFVLHIHAFDPQNIIMIYSRHVNQLLIYGNIIFEPYILFPTSFSLIAVTCVIMIQYLFSICKKYHNYLFKKCMFPMSLDDIADFRSTERLCGDTN